MRQLILLVVGMLMALTAQALGLGGLTVNSALGQPMDAEIEVVSVTIDDVPKMKIGIASPAVFEQNGIPYVQSLHLLKFKVKEKPDGQVVIGVSSKEPIREPVVEFVLDVSWPRGHLRRAYSAIISPVGM
ncbi:MAG: hypothetical protein OEW89_05380 [Gammaproteobacteria bacterium]|nr:hypothetical protein [Gammaproteobacteria bacterium]MDH5594770.1 hypothetical protein [Gammaproteobacteria bacterium]MDH5614631.1 hypothetical protein [Gammaproteobacteria bacterium]